MNIIGCCDVSPVICCVVGICLLMYIYGKWRLQVLSRAGIPGPPPTIFLGHFKQFATNGLVDPARRLRKQYGKVYGQYVGARPFIFVHDIDILKEVLVKRFANFRNRKTVLNSINTNPFPLETILSFARDDQWHRLRSIMTATFTGSKLRHMCRHLNAAAAALSVNLGVAAGKQEACCVRDYFIPYALDTIASTAFGVQIKSKKDFRRLLVTNATQIFTSGFFKRNLLYLSAFPVIKPLLGICGVCSLKPSAVQFLTTLVKTIIDERKKQRDAQKNMDFLQIMIDAEKNNVLQGTTARCASKHMSSDEIYAQGILFFGSFDGIAASLSFLSRVLATHPDIQKKLLEEIRSVIGDEEPTYEKLQEIEYLDHFIRETLRLYPPIPLMGRETANTITIKGYTFPKGSIVIVPLMEMQRDPEHFDEPDAFQPDRWKGNINPLAWLPFGYGQRQCLAGRFVMCALKIALIHVLRRVKFVRPPDMPEMLELNCLTIGRVVPKEAIKLRIEHRDKA